MMVFASRQLFEMQLQIYSCVKQAYIKANPNDDLSEMEEINERC